MKYLFRRLLLQATAACFATVFLAAFGAAADTTLFKQPNLPRIAGHFCVRCNPGPGNFEIVQWQNNPNGNDVPTSWPLGKMTGLFPAYDIQQTQVSFKDNKQSSGAQVAGDSVGAYIDSFDLPLISKYGNFIITPSIDFNPQPQPYKMEHDRKRIKVSFDLQVPVAIDQGKPRSTTYIVSDLMFFDRASRSKLYIDVIIFKNGIKNPSDFLFFDAPTSTPVALGALNLTSDFVDPAPQSQMLQNVSWIGWRHFSYSISDKNFLAAIKAVKAKFPNLAMSSNLSGWKLKNWHLNAELLYKDGPARMGWSMRRLLISSSN